MNKTGFVLIISSILLLIIGGWRIDCADHSDELPTETLSGQTHKRRPGKRRRALDEQREQEAATIAQLEALGYVGHGEEAPPDQTGVVYHDPAKAWPGFNLYSSGGFEGALLLDMEGTEVHRWEHSVVDVFPDAGIDPSDARSKGWRRVIPLEHGHVLVIISGWGVFRLNRHSEVVWATRCNAHHDLELLPNGQFWLLTREARVIHRFDPSVPVSEDFFTLLDANGTLIRNLSVLEAFESHPDFDEVMAGRTKKSQDLFHTNAVRLLPTLDSPHHPAFTPGRMLTSMRNLDVLALVDLDTETVVWWQRGPFARQHDPRPLPDGQILLFDNRGLGEISRVIEIEPTTGAVTWSWSGDHDDPLRSPTCGLSDRLPNENTLIVESAGGRVLELTPEEELVWEFRNPVVVNDLVGRVFEFRRIDAPWLDPPVAAPQ